MSGLREKKKLLARSRILEASRSLFQRNGFEKTTTDAIADLAEVSVGTIYNHYKSKEEIFVASLFGSFKEGFPFPESFDSKDKENIDSSYLISFMQKYLQQLLQYGKPILRELMKAGVNSIGNDLSLISQLEALDWKLMEYMAEIIDLIEIDKEISKLKSEIIYSIIAFEFLRYVYEENYEILILFEKIEKKIRMILE